MNEVDFLEEVSHTYVSPDDPQYEKMDELSVATFKPFLKKDYNGLMLGYFNGRDTDKLYPLLKRLDVVEGCKEFIGRGLAKGYPNVYFFNSLFEDFELPEDTKPYDCVFALYVMEHVLDVDKFLDMISRVISKDGLLFIVVPNSRSLSRQLAKHMELIDDLKTLTENDLNHGHRRVYDRVELNRDLERNGFEVISQGGIMLKILADFQMSKMIELGILGDAQLEGLYKLGLEYPDLCGSLFSICKQKD